MKIQQYARVITSCSEHAITQIKLQLRGSLFEKPDNLQQRRSRPIIPGMSFQPQTTSRNWDFELKNGFGFWGRGFIAGARFEHTTLLSKL